MTQSRAEAEKRDGEVHLPGVGDAVLAQRRCRGSKRPDWAPAEIMQCGEIPLRLRLFMPGARAGRVVRQRATVRSGRNRGLPLLFETPRLYTG
jgi:hypothetical protein